MSTVAGGKTQPEGRKKKKGAGKRRATRSKTILQGSRARAAGKLDASNVTYPRGSIKCRQWGARDSRPVALDTRRVLVEIKLEGLAAHVEKIARRKEIT